MCWQQLRWLLTEELTTCGEGSSPPPSPSSQSQSHYGETFSPSLRGTATPTSDGTECRESERGLRGGVSVGAPASPVQEVELPTAAWACPFLQPPVPGEAAKPPELRAPSGPWLLLPPKSRAEPRLGGTALRFSRYQAASHLPSAPNLVCSKWDRLKNVPPHSLGHRPSFLFFNLFIYLFIFGCTTGHAGILFPRPGIEPIPPAVEAWSLNHCTAREVPRPSFLSLGTSRRGGLWGVVL